MGGSINASFSMKRYAVWATKRATHCMYSRAQSNAVEYEGSQSEWLLKPFLDWIDGHDWDWPTNAACGHDQKDHQDNQDLIDHHDQSYQNHHQNPNDQSYSSRSGWPEWSSRCLRYPMPRMTINDDQLSVTHCHDSARRWLRKTIYDSDDDLGQEKLLNIQMMMIPTIVPYPTSGIGLCHGLSVYLFYSWYPNVFLTSI